MSATTLELVALFGEAAKQFRETGNSAYATRVEDYASRIQANEYFGLVDFLELFGPSESRLERRLTEDELRDFFRSTAEFSKVVRRAADLDSLELLARFEAELQEGIITPLEFESRAFALVEAGDPTAILSCLPAMTFDGVIRMRNGIALMECEKTERLPQADGCMFVKIRGLSTYLVYCLGGVFAYEDDPSAPASVMGQLAWNPRDGYAVDPVKSIEVTAYDDQVVITSEIVEAAKHKTLDNIWNPDLKSLRQRQFLGW